MVADPDGARLTPPVVRAPNGVIEDLRKYWMSEAPHYDPAKITVPPLVILAEWDADTPPPSAGIRFLGNSWVKTSGRETDPSTGQHMMRGRTLAPGGRPSEYELSEARLLWWR